MVILFQNAVNGNENNENESNANAEVNAMNTIMMGGRELARLWTTAVNAAHLGLTYPARPYLKCRISLTGVSWTCGTAPGRSSPPPTTTTTGAAGVSTRERRSRKT